jgi:hypothetical protein
VHATPTEGPGCRAGRMAAGLQATPGLGLLRTSKGAGALPRPPPHRGNWPAPSGWPALTRSWGPGGELGPRHGGAPAGRSATGALVCLKRPQARTAADWPMGRPASSHVYLSYSAPCPGVTGRPASDGHGALRVALRLFPRGRRARGRLPHPPVSVVLARLLARLHRRLPPAHLRARREACQAIEMEL